MIECRGLHRNFNGRPVLNGVDLSIPAGQITVVIGRSGEGKTVFLKHLIGLLQTDQGRVMVDGQDLSASRGADLRAIRARLGIVFQGGALFDSLSVFENVAFPLRHRPEVLARTGLASHRDESGIRSRVSDILEHVGLAGHEGRFPDEISGGMAKRVALARALVAAPDIILFDEPVTGLDPVIKNTIFDLIAQTHRRYRFTGVIVSHDIPEVFVLAHRVAMLHGGEIIVNDAPEAVMASQDPRVRHFLSGGKEPL